MGYLIIKRKNGNFSVLHRVDHGVKNGKQVLESRIIAKGSREYFDLGLNETTTLEQAKKILEAVRKDTTLKLSLERRRRIEQRLNDRKAISGAYLPVLIVEKFENEVLPVCKWMRQDRWLIAKEIISSVSVSPEEWHWKPNTIMDQFAKRGDSLDYSRRLLRIINKYGAFYCKELNKAFLPVEKPVGEYKKSIKYSYNLKKPSRKTEILKLEHLDLAKKDLSVKEFNGLYLMFWAGLRKEEAAQVINSLPSKDFRSGAAWFLQEDDSRFAGVLHVFQYKLFRTGTDPDLCWKAIPFCEREQIDLVSILKTKNLSMPPMKRLKNLLQFKITNRSARKGFVALMQFRGYREEVYSRWLGHIGRSTVRQYYETKEVAYYEPPIDRISLKEQRGRLKFG